MINFRFHLVSLVAVFLALAVGIVMGYGVLGQPTVDTLQHRIDTVEANAEARRHENDALKSQVEQLDSQTTALGPYAVTNRLSNMRLLVVAVRGVDGDTMRNTVQLARRGGADAPGILWLEDNWLLKNADERKALAGAINTNATKRTTVRERGLRALAGRLAGGPSVGTDLLRSLTDAGFVSYEGVGDAGNRSLSELGGGGTSVLLVVGSDGSIPGADVVVPFARGSLLAQLPLAIGEAYRQKEHAPRRGGLIGPVQSDATLVKKVSTVDDLDRPSGPIVALLAIADLARGMVGHYGFGEGAAAAVPNWWQP